MRDSRVLRGLGPVLIVVLAAAALAGAVAWAALPPRLSVHGGFVDLSVYQYGGRMVLDGLPLYGSRDPATNLRFTYPPFAAVAMVPLGPLPFWLATALWTAASVAALAGAILLVGRALGHALEGRHVALLTVGALALEPVWQNLTFGQINLLLMLAVLIDLVHPERRWSGLLVGIAAGVKLTPLVFVVLLVMVGRRAAAGRAVLAFAGTVAVGLAVVPGSAKTYWTENLIAAGRVGPPELAHNQSVFGALTRLLDGPPSTPLWLAVAGPLAIAVVVVGALCWRRGDRVLGAGLGALAMLLASPVSWSHHWVWAAPIGLALWTRNRWAGLAWTAVFVARPFVWPPWGERREYGWSPVEHLPGNAYLLAAVAVSIGLAVRLGRPTVQIRRIPRPRRPRSARPALRSASPR
ncbi:glycosyltransferase 87 family protein [Actinoplanes sp. CA-054009]